MVAVDVSRIISKYFLFIDLTHDCRSVTCNLPASPKIIIRTARLPGPLTVQATITGASSELHIMHVDITTLI